MAARCGRTASQPPGSCSLTAGKHVELAAWRGWVEAVLDQPADRQQASQWTTTRGSRRGRGRCRCRSRPRRRQGAPGVRASGWRGQTGHRPRPASDQSITPVISSPSMNTWATCRSPCDGTPASTAGAQPRRPGGCDVPGLAGRTSFATSHSQFAVELRCESRRGSYRAMAAAARRAASGAAAPAAAHAAAGRSTARRGGRVPSLGRRRARARAACAHRTSGVEDRRHGHRLDLDVGARLISVDLQEHVADAQGRALVMGDDDLDLLHVGHYRGMTTDCRRLIACDCAARGHASGDCDLGDRRHRGVGKTGLACGEPTR